MEEALSGLQGIKKINSTSLDNESSIHIKFKSNKKTENILNEVRDRIFEVLPELPPEAKRPFIYEVKENNEGLLYIGFYDNSRSFSSVSDYLKRNMEERLKMIEGVARVNSWGQSPYIVEINIEPARLIERNITLQEVIEAIRREKIFANGGIVEGKNTKRTLVLSSPLDSPAELENITIKVKSFGPVRIKDIAEVQVKGQKPWWSMEAEGKPTIGYEVQIKPDANPSAVARLLHTFVEDLKNELPHGMQAQILVDLSVPFDEAMRAVYSTLVEALILVAAITIVCLASFRAAVIPIITVPLCLIGTGMLLWLLDCSINPISLLALVLAVGLVVDDAIVVVENIHRHMEEEKISALLAAKKSMKEISFAVIVMTITLAAVYIPVTFQASESSAFFKEFAWTLSGSVLISGFVALTLAPALCGRFLELHSNPWSVKIEHYWQCLHTSYQKALQKSLSHPKFMCTFAVLLALLGGFLFTTLPSEFAPVEDEDSIRGFVGVTNEIPEAVRDEWLQKIYQRMQAIPEKVLFLAFKQPQQSFWSLRLTPSKTRKRSAFEIKTALEKSLSDIYGPFIGVQVGHGGGGGGNHDLKFIVQYQGDYSKLLTRMQDFIKKTQSLKIPGVNRIYSDELQTKPRLQVSINRKLCAELGLSIAEIEETVAIFLSGQKVGDYYFDGYPYDIMLRAKEAYRQEHTSLNDFFIITHSPYRIDAFPDFVNNNIAQADTQIVPLSSIVNIEEVLQPEMYKHFNKMRGAAVNVSLHEGVDLESTVKKLEQELQSYIPIGGRYSLSGKGEQYFEAKQAMWFTFGLALVFIYLVLAALFESLIYPLIVLVTVPLSVTGAVLAVKMAGGTNNLYTQIGLVTLIGLITKHGILIVEFTNRLIKRGEYLHIAVVKAATLRLKPVLMTTAAMIVGAIPLAFGSGAYALARQHIALVIIGGMLTGTFFSLFVVPLVYQLCALHKTK